MISVLFCDPKGVYSESDVDMWCIDRNAMNFKGENPVICHPPCQLWGRFAIINYKRWGGEHNKPKNDGGKFKFALDVVRKNGGVLEHPAFSYAWDEYGLKKPRSIGWVYCGDNEYVCEVWQSAYGHLANKRTWLFYKGEKPFELRWDRPKGTHQIGFYDQRGKDKNKPTLSGRKASATPVEFRDELIKLARSTKAERRVNL